MPSRSQKQHNLMEAVAHNPGFAKKVGIPQSVGKHFHEADKMKRKKYDEGGDIDVGKIDTSSEMPDIDTPSRQLPASSMGLSSFGRAFRDARNSGAKTFTYKGKSYTTDMAPRPTTLLPKEGRFGMMKGRAPTFDSYNKATGITYAKGGHVKHADELKGKAKETKSIAKEEMKALKRGHAPKKIMEHEKAEHKAMGYKHGGKIETPHKGFGMGKGTGHGRKVTKAKTPKDEMPRKGFAMKKGGHVKHMKRGGKSRGVAPAMPGLPGNLAGALGGMGGGPGGMSGASPMPQPGMKKGGHVAHHAHHGHGHQIHHHHHYAKGGHVKAGHRNEDGIAQRGHTRAKHVKMASGGHVGSHPSRRADGAAAKGHTRCKIV
jgi:hypothetical protein